MATNRLETLNAFRFFSATALVLYHVLPVWPGLSFAAVPSNVIAAHSWLIVGLPFFYALSGFVLFHSYAERIPATGSALGAFYRRRFARLAPMFYASLALVMPAAWFTLERGGAASPGLALGEAAVLSLLFLGAWFPSALLLNFPTWSVSVEMFFYLLFPFVARRLIQSGARAAWLIIFFIYAGSALFFTAAGAAIPGLLAWPWIPGNVAPAVTNFFQLNPLVHLPEFVTGILLAMRWREAGEIARARGADALILIGTATLLLLAWSPLRPPFLMVASFLTLPILCLLLWGGAGPRRLGFRWLEARPFVYLGESAYAIYVFHMPLAYAWLTGSWVRRYPVTGLFLYLVFLTAAAALIHRAIEEPLRRWIAGKGARA